MRIESIDYFIKAVNEGSINKAATQLHLNHQNLGKMLTGMEDELGIQLLNRDKRGISLTAEGQYVYEQFQDMMTIYGNIRTYVETVKTTTAVSNNNLAVFIASSSMPAKLARSMKNMCSRYPDLSISIRECSTKRALAGVMEEDNGYANILVPQKTNDRELEKQGFCVLMQREVQLVLYVPADMKVQAPLNGIDIYQVLDLPLLLYSAYELEDNDLYKVLKSFGKPNIQFNISNYATFAELSRTGRYISVGALYAGSSALAEQVLQQSAYGSEDFRLYPILYKNKPILLKTMWVNRKDVRVAEPIQYLLHIL